MRIEYEYRCAEYEYEYEHEYEHEHEHEHEHEQLNTEDTERGRKLGREVLRTIRLGQGSRRAASSSRTSQALGTLFLDRVVVEWQEPIINLQAQQIHRRQIQPTSMQTPAIGHGPQGIPATG